MAVDPLWAFDKKIAEVRDENSGQGFLRVQLDESVWSDGEKRLSVDLALVFQQTGETEFVFSDRSDPEPDDAREELASGRIDWFGSTLVVLRWLDSGEADQVNLANFASWGN